MRRVIFGAAIVAGLFAAAPASALFHQMTISEVYPGTEACPDCAFVELQMYASGQTLLTGHELTVRNAAGATTATVTLDDTVANGQSNRKVLLGDSSVPTRDFDANIGTFVLAAGGAVCFENVDCVSWGTFTGSTPSPTGTPVAGAIADGSSLTRRLDTAGCATFLENSDDSDDSATDFLVTATETPENNAAAVQGACPNTTITKKPPKRTTKRRTTFKFASSINPATFECKLDSGNFKPCDSPFTKRVRRGRHTFRVRATAGGVLDPTPATYRWRVVKP